MYDGLLMVIKDVWEEGTVVKDWKNAEIVPIPKTGNLCQCESSCPTSHFINTASGWASVLAFRKSK